MSKIKHIQTLWEDFQALPFPSELVREEIRAIDPVTLDTVAAGCIDTFIAQEGHVDLWRCAILGLCFHDIALLTYKLEGESQAYFQQLEELVRLVLQSIRDTQRI